MALGRHLGQVSSTGAICWSHRRACQLTADPGPSNAARGRAASPPPIWSSCREAGLAAARSIVQLCQPHRPGRIGQGAESDALVSDLVARTAGVITEVQARLPPSLPEQLPDTTLGDLQASADPLLRQAS